MVKPVLGLAAAVGMTLWAGATMSHGCKDARSSLTHLDYYPIRDMRRTVAVLPQKVWLQVPDSLTVPVSGREAMPDPNQLMVHRDEVAARYVDPGAADDS